MFLHNLIIVHFTTTAICFNAFGIHYSIRGVFIFSRYDYGSYFSIALFETNGYIPVVEAHL